MTKSQLVDEVSSRTGQPHKAIESAVHTIFESMVDALGRDERVEIRGFGNFTIRQYKAYTGRNPKTGGQVDVSPKRMPFFKVGKDLRERVDANG
jgi:integration host factor subunit beta